MQDPIDMVVEIPASLMLLFFVTWMLTPIIVDMANDIKGEIERLK